MKRLFALWLVLLCMGQASAETIAQQVGAPEKIAFDCESTSGRTHVYVDAEVVVPAVSTMVMCIGCNVFVANSWSETATMLSFSPASFEVALTVMRKTMKLTTPYDCAVQIFLLLFQYVLLMSMLQLTCTLLKSRKAGIMAALIINFAGYVLTPDRFMTWLHLPMEMQYYANLISAWLSPLQHATYTMHNFGYDLLPRVATSHLLLGGCSALLLIIAVVCMKHYSFNFAGGYTDE